MRKLKLETEAMNVFMSSPGFGFYKFDSAKQRKVTGRLTEVSCGQLFG